MDPPTCSNATPPLLSMQGICKSFPGVVALKGIDLDLHHGEVLALLGENGAGKSTLIKVLGGAHLPDQGEIFIRGSKVSIHSPSQSESLGISVIYQEFNLVPSLSAVDNIFLGNEITRAGFILRDRQRAEAAKLFNKFGVEINAEIPCRFLTIAQQQIVEIAKALSHSAEILIMDEPSATLTLQEVERLFDIILELKKQGLGIIYISHRLEEIDQIADRVLILRDGAGIATKAVDDVDRHQLIELMVGRKLENEFPARTKQIGEEVLSVSALNRKPKVRDVSFSLHRGEVLGITGLVGAGRTETARLIFGADPLESGTIRLYGNEVRIRSPREAVRHGICLLTEDRKTQGLVLIRSVVENFGLPNLEGFSRFGLLSLSHEMNRYQDFAARLNIRAARPGLPISNLSGGNQQKVVLAKWLARDTEIFIFDEPTRGIDIGAKYEIYLLINELAARGKAIIMISSELPEILGMSDRILVMHKGRITGEITDMETATQTEIMQLAIA